MKKVLISLIGNRDVQFTVSVPQHYLEYLETNNANPETKVISKTKKDNTFWEISKKLMDDYKTLEDSIILPMLQKALDKNIDIEKIVLISTCQSPPYKQDTKYIGEIMATKLIYDGYEIEHRTIIRNPNQFEEVSDYFLKLYDEFSDCKILVQNSGGTPTMRSASEFSGFFRNISFLTYTESRSDNISSVSKQERKIKGEIVKRMLDNYDYAGVLELNRQNKIVRIICQFALARLSLDLEKARNYFNIIKKNVDNKNLSIAKNIGNKQYEAEIVQAALVKLHQQSWGDFVWRLFTLHDNILIPHVEKKLEGKVEYDSKNKHKSWVDMIRKNSKLVEFLGDYKLDYKKNTLDWSYPNKKAYEAILNFFNISLNNKDDLSCIYQVLNHLAHLRNDIAHRYAGINKKLIQDRIPSKYFSQRNRKIAEFVEVLKRYVGVQDIVYDSINIEIIKSL